MSLLFLMYAQGLDNLVGDSNLLLSGQSIVGLALGWPFARNSLQQIS